MSYRFDFSKTREALEQSSPKTSLKAEAGALLRTLVASKPIGVFLELGTGLSTAWMLDGMDEKSYLVSLSNDARLQEIAKAHLTDERIEFRLGDVSSMLQSFPRKAFDLIVSNTWTEQNSLEETLKRLRPGGLFMITHISPDSGETQKLSQHPDLKVAWLSIGDGLMLAAKTL